MSDFNLEEKFPDLRPVHKAPTLSTYNGIGTTLVGRRGYDEETGTYVTTQCFSILFIPLIPLAAYRVAQAGDGTYYFLGRVPLSAFAWRWNVALPIMLALVAGALAWRHHTESPDYKAGVQLAEADRLADQGEAGKAARMYQEVMQGTTSKAGEAQTKLYALIEAPPESLAEAAEVFRVAIDLHRQGQDTVPNPFDRAVQLAEKNEESDPKGALAVLEVVAPLDPQPADRIRVQRRLLERVAAGEPDDPELASRLAVVCEAMGDRKACEAVLKRHENRLGSLDGAAVLARIYAGQGKFEQADKLLSAYLEARLPQLRTAEQKFMTAVQTARNRIMESLKTGKAPGFNYERYKMAGEAEQERMLQDYVNPRIRSDADILAALKEQSGQGAVVSAAIDLGIVRLEHAQGLADPDQRKKGLERAEEAFLKVQREAGETDNYRFNLGQVYYWLGKHAEGKKLFDELLKNRNRAFEVLLHVAHRLREVGDVSGARALAEEAYNKTGDTHKKHEAAMIRSLMPTDLDDRITWLAKCDSASLNVKASLAGARGSKAQEDGKDDEAAALLREALAIYAKIPEDSSVLNNSALIHFQLYDLTHDREQFLRGADKLDRCLALEPSNSLILSNATSRMFTALAQDLIGNEIYMKLLKRGANLDLLGFLYRDQAGRDKLVVRMSSHPAFQKAVAYAEKLMLLAPRRRGSYQIAEALYAWAHDMNGLRGVWQKLQSVDVDRDQDDRETLDYYAGKKDDKYKADWKTGQARQEKIWEEARRSKGTTLAVAAVSLATTRMNGVVYGEPVDADGIVKLAEQAHAAAPSTSTKADQSQGRLSFRAHTKRWRRRYPPMAKWRAGPRGRWELPS